jgi:hypothetical protein
LKKLTLYIIILLLGAGACTYGQFNKSGRTSLQFLKIGVGARQAALGETSIANVTDINSVYWNPAAIALIDGAQAAFNYNQWIGGLNVTSAAAGVNISGFGTVAFNFISLDYGNIDEALVTSNSGGIDTRTGNTFTGNDLALGMSFSKMFTDKLAIGVSVKYLREKLYTYSTSLWAFDVGSYYDTGWRGIRLGMSAQNFSSQARFLQTKEAEQQSYELPLLFRIGWSIDLLGGQNLFLGGSPDKHKVTVNMEAIHSNDYAERLHVGIEYWAFNLFAIRGGYRFNYEEGNLSAGFGVNYDAGPVNLKFDYAYVQYDYLDSPHRFSVIMTF